MKKGVKKKKGVSRNSSNNKNLIIIVGVLVVLLAVIFFWNLEKPGPYDEEELGSLSPIIPGMRGMPGDGGDDMDNNLFQKLKNKKQSKLEPGPTGFGPLDYWHVKDCNTAKNNKPKNPPVKACEKKCGFPGIAGACSNYGIKDKSCAVLRGRITNKYKGWIKVCVDTTDGGGKCVCDKQVKV